jgi:NAD-dependent deacetylase
MNLIDLVKAATNIVAFSGAGISTESGIPDFRSSNGLYTSGEFAGYEPQQLLTKKMLRTKPNLVLKFYKERLMKMVDKEPNRAHYALKKLEDMGKLSCVITQNIDNLHRKAGQKNLWELHGNGSRFKCNIECGEQYTYEDFLKMLETSEKPMCRCFMSFIRPDVVLFDEALDDDQYDNAYYAAKKCDLMISIGSSLVVMPACGLVDQIPVESKLVIINKDKTPFDSKADLVIRENCGEVLENLVKEL